MPNKIFSIGPPKQADSDITGYPSLATVMSATKSPREFPTAKIVRPRIASEIPRITPKALSTPTTSFAIVDIQAMATTKPRKQRRKRYFGGLEVVVVEIKIAKTTSEARSE